jgi:hypothetical protein
VATISVIVPTVKGREDWLDRCVAGYEENGGDVQVLVVRGERSCGEAWIRGAKRATGDYLHFTADDLVPLPGWWEPAVEACDAGELPGANVLTVETAAGWDPESTMHAMAYLQNGRPVQNVLVPFLSRAQFDRGDWLLPIHYGSDDWVTFLADQLGIDTTFVAGYAFGHGAAPEGRLFDSRTRDIPILLDRMSEFGAPPDVYVSMGRSYGWFPAFTPIREAAGAPQGRRRAAGEMTDAADYYWNGPTLPAAPAVGA